MPQRMGGCLPRCRLRARIAAAHSRGIVAFAAILIYPENEKCDEKIKI
jgi:hypothetical protein